jgi:hypothetical protein
MKRHLHWATRHYHQFLLDRAKAPFAWGSNDCALFAADGIMAICGVDIADDFRGKYDSQSSAFALIHSVCGGSTVADAAAHCAAKHNLPELKYPLMAQRGDLVIATNGDGSPIAGLIHLNGRHIVSVSEKGLVLLPITSVTRAWRV